MAGIALESHMPGGGGSAFPGDALCTMWVPSGSTRKRCALHRTSDGPTPAHPKSLWISAKKEGLETSQRPVPGLVKTAENYTMRNLPVGAPWGTKWGKAIPEATRSGLRKCWSIWPNLKESTLLSKSQVGWINTLSAERILSRYPRLFPDATKAKKPEAESQDSIETRGFSFLSRGCWRFPNTSLKMPFWGKVENNFLKREKSTC